MPEPILCRECGHDIDEHRWDGCWHEEKVNFKGLDECDLSASDVARAYADERVREAMDSHRCDEQTTEAAAKRLHSVRDEVAVEATLSRQAHRSCRVDHFAHDYCRWVGMSEAYQNVLNILDRSTND